MTPSFHRKLFFAAATALTLLAGCGHYQLGSTISENLRDVYVPNVRNESGQPGVEIALTQALIKEIQREGTLRIVPEERAGSRLDVVVVGYRQDSIRYNRSRSSVSEEYRMVLRAQSTFTDLNPADPDKAILLQAVREGDDTFVRGTDVITARQRCLPRAAEELAEHIVEDCVSAW